MGLWSATSEMVSKSRLAKDVRAVDLDMALPFVLVPLALAVGSTCFTATVLVMIVLAMSMLYLMQRQRPNNRTQFFYTWTLSSVFYLFMVFEMDLLMMLEITQEENIFFLLLLIGAGWCFHRVRIVVHPDTARGKDYSPVLTADSFHCSICQIEVNNRYFHSVWLDACISSANYRNYILALCLSDICLLFGVNLGLTSICEPYILFWTILMPEDCSDVYYEFGLAVCYMSCVYCMGYALVITLVLIHQCFTYAPRHAGLSFNQSSSVLSA